MSYTPEQTLEMKAAYLAAENKKEIITALAKRFGRSEKSIIGKLAKEKVYQKQIYVNKLGELPETKKEIIARIASILSLNPEKLQGLEKAPKSELRLLENALVGKNSP